MRIAQISTAASAVGPVGSHSVESMVYCLSSELTRLGHEVTVFAAAGSTAPCEVVETLPGPYARNGSPADWQLCEWMTLCAAVKRSGEFDVMHSHAYLWGIPLEPFAGCPLVHTMHVTPDVNTAAPWELNPASCVTALSEFQWQPYPDLRPAAVIPHGVDVGQHTFQPVRGDYACFLGRFTRCKGPVQAIQAARNVGLPLILAGPRNDYFDTHVAPLVDGDSVVYAGPVYGADRDALLGGAAVLLYPLQCPEPFGLVMVEAMMSGTPVAAYSIGAVPEVLDDGITGAGAVPDEDFTVAIERAMSLDRSTVRQRAIERFSAERMAASYLDVYERVVEQASVREG